jgi:hypothetical protein
VKKVARMTPMGEKWSVRSYLEGDEKLILKLRQVIRGEKYAVSY